MPKALKCPLNAVARETLLLSPEPVHHSIGFPANALGEHGLIMIVIQVSKNLQFTFIAKAGSFQVGLNAQRINTMQILR